MYKKTITIIILIFLIESCKTKDIVFTDNHQAIFVLANKNNGNYFSKNKFESHKTQKKQSYLYTYYFSDNSNKIQLVYKEYESFDDFEMNNSTPYFNVNKRFLKNNKTNIYNIKKLRAIGYKESHKIFKNAKHIFLIEKDLKNSENLIIKKVRTFEIGEI